MTFCLLDTEFSSCEDLELPPGNGLILEVIKRKLGNNFKKSHQNSCYRVSYNFSLLFLPEKELHINFKGVIIVDMSYNQNISSTVSPNIGVPGK